MAEATPANGPLPVVPFLKIPEGADPYLQGSRCKACKATFIGEREHCSSCGARDSMDAISLSNQGELYVYSIVYRSFPGIEVPFVSAVVDLEGGGTLKGQLKGVDPAPEKIEMGMPVEVYYETAPMKDAEGNEYLTYYFRPRS